MSDERQRAIENAAREVIANDGFNCRTDPRPAVDAMGVALDASATLQDIVDEMGRQRTA